MILMFETFEKEINCRYPYHLDNLVGRFIGDYSFQVKDKILQVNVKDRDSKRHINLTKRTRRSSIHK